MTTMTFNGKTFEVDDEIASIVHALNAAGISTVASCSGHGMRPGRISLADGRELFVLPSYEIGQWFETQFPRDINGQTKEERAADEPPAVDVAPIAKLTVRDGLVQRAGLYAPGLPDGDHDVFPVPLSPKGELRPHVLAEPPNVWQPIETAPKLGKWVLLWWPAITDAAFVGYCIDGQWRAATSGDRWPTLPGPTHWMPLPEGPTVTKEASR